MDFITELFSSCDDLKFAVIETILLEDIGWTMKLTSSYKTGIKRYRNDKRVMKNFDMLMDFITQQQATPSITEYPQELYVHAIASDKRFSKGTLWAHLKGQKIGLLFIPDYKNKTLTLLHMGTHQDLGWR